MSAKLRQWLSYLGQYVHSWHAGKVLTFMDEHPNMFKANRGLKAEYVVANTMIEYVQEDQFIMSYLYGEKDIIITAEMYGVTWKVMMNVLSSDSRQIIDLATTRSITEKVWDDVPRRKVSFVEVYRYPLKMAIYSEIERLAMDRAPRDWSEFLIVAVSKERSPDKAIINLTDFTRLEVELAQAILYVFEH